jgi:hypothetical protein
LSTENPYAEYIENERQKSSVNEGTGHRLVTVVPPRNQQRLRRFKERSRGELQRLGKTTRGLSRYGYAIGKRRAAKTKLGKKYLRTRERYRKFRSELRRYSA